MNIFLLYTTYTKDIYLSFTRKCNFACAFCYCKNYLSEKTIPTYKKIDSFITFISSLPHLKTITLIGGEPLICKKEILYFFEQIQKLNRTRKKQIMISVFTNGSFYIDLRKYRTIIEEIVVAIAGFKEDHNKIRYDKNTHQGSFDTIISNYLKYVNDGISLRFNYVVTPKSILTLFDSMEKIINHLAPLEIALSIQFDHFTKWGKHLTKIIKYYWTIFKLNRKHPTYNIYPHHMAQVDHARACTAGTAFIGIDLYSGKIHGCHENNGSTQDVIGTMTQGIPTLTLQNNIKKLALQGYTYKNTPRIVSSWLFRLFGGHICKMRNHYHCKSDTIIPTYFIIIFMCTKIYNFFYSLSRVLQSNK